MATLLSVFVSFPQLTIPSSRSSNKKSPATTLPQMRLDRGSYEGSSQIVAGSSPHYRFCFLSRSPSLTSDPLLPFGGKVTPYVSMVPTPSAVCCSKNLLTHRPTNSPTTGATALPSPLVRSTFLEIPSMPRQKQGEGNCCHPCLSGGLHNVNILPWMISLSSLRRSLPCSPLLLG